MSPVRRTKKKIGELLLLKGLITREQLQQALLQQAILFKSTQRQDKLLGQILIELGYVSEEEFSGILALQCGYPYIDIDQCKIEPAVLALIPENMAKKYGIFPIDKIQDIFTVAMVHPLDKLAIEQIKKFTKSDVRIFLTTSLELENMVLKYYGPKKE
jgi:type IV pilus assembly protein PilB